MREKRKKMGNVPNLRFKGFGDEWEEKTLGQISKLITKGTTPSNFTNQGVRFIKIECFNNDIIDESKCLFIDEQTHNKELRRSILEENDLLFAIAGATVGKVNVVHKEILPANTNQALAIIRLIEKENWRFIYQILKSEIMRKYIQESISVGAQPNLNLEQINNFSFFQPDLAEQQKIASFLALIDDRIATQSKIVENLETLIQGLREKLFKQKLRFKDENGQQFPDWEVEKLDNVLSLPEKVKPSFIDKDKLLTVKLHLKGLTRNENTESLSLGSTNYFVRKEGQFIYGKQNLFNGAFAIVSKEFDGFLSSGDVPALNINSQLLNSQFLLHYFSREAFYKKLEAISSGSGSKRIHEEILLNVEVVLPNLNEQAKISDFLSTLNNKINIEKSLLQQMQNQKKYLLQNLFI